MAGQKRGFGNIGKRSELGHKRVKMKDFETVFSSQGMENHCTKSSVNKQVPDICNVAQKKILLIDNETLTISLGVTDTVEMKKERLSIDLNAKVDMTDDSAPAHFANTNNVNSSSKPNIDKSRSAGFDLNVEDVSSSANHDLVFLNEHIEHLRPRDDECGSTCSPMKEKDPMKVWKEMKQNGFMSSSHGGVPIPKQRGRKSKAYGLKKNMEIARREQVDRFPKVAAPSGLLNGLNPGIINHVRNSRQFHSIIEALVRSERCGNVLAGNRDEKIQIKTERIESTDRKNREFNIRGNNDSSMNISNLCDEDSADVSSISSLSFKAANIVASQWLELLHQDIKGRLASTLSLK